MNEKEWRILRIGKIYIFVPKTEKYPKYLELDACDKCGLPHYKIIKMKLIGKWIGDFKEEFGSWLNELMKND